MKNPFANKKQIEKVKALPVLESNKTVTSKLKLHSLRIVFSVAQTDAYTAELIYCERPTNWSDQGMTNTEKIKADDWPQLIDKVVQHFEASPTSNPPQ